MTELGNQIMTLAQTPGFADTLFSEFLREEIAIDLYTQLNNGFYWQAGEYRLDLEIKCASPTKAENYSWQVKLTADDEKKLRLNSIIMMKELCNIKIQYNFIYKPYDTVT